MANANRTFLESPKTAGPLIFASYATFRNAGQFKVCRRSAAGDPHAVDPLSDVVYSASRSKSMRYIIAITFALSMMAPSLSAAPVSGEAVYKQRCPACHDSGNARIPPKDELKKLSVTHILRSLDFGEMNNIATKLRQEEREAVAAYLGVPGDFGIPPATAYCSDRNVKLTGRGK